MGKFIQINDESNTVVLLRKDTIRFVGDVEPSGEKNQLILSLDFDGYDGIEKTTMYFKPQDLDEFIKEIMEE